MIKNNGFSKFGIKVCVVFILGVSFETAVYGEIRSIQEIREHEVIVQKWDTSCGAAAMATVFTYIFDDPVSETEVAKGLLRQTEPLKVRHRGGFSMLDMKRYAAERGYLGIGFLGMSIDDLKYMDAPIVPVNIHGYNHYVVYRGIKENGDIWLADPAYGNRTVSRERFEEVWMEGMVFALLKQK